MKHRKLRIAWSVAWGLIAVLLVVLWVRSLDNIHMIPPSDYQMVVGHGRIYFGRADDKPERRQYFNADFINDEGRQESVLIAIDPARSLDVRVIGAIAFALVVVPWLRFRFSLRTLLIATTLVAVVLGLSVYLFQR
jgi:hypothetical protein